MFYSDYKGGEFLDFPLPGEFDDIKLDHMTLVEPNTIYALGKDRRGNDCFSRYDLLTHSVVEMSQPTMSHKDFKICSSGRESIFLVGTMSNKICEKYNIQTNEWTLLPSIPEISINTHLFADFNFVYILIVPFAVTEQRKRAYYRLGIEDAESWEDITLSDEKPVDFSVNKLPVPVKYPAKIVNYPYYYFVDTT